VVILSSDGVRRGHDGLREQASKLQRELPNCTFHYGTRLVEGEVAFLEWSAEADGACVPTACWSARPKGFEPLTF
jgi:hypothetical protein